MAGLKRGIGDNNTGMRNLVFLCIGTPKIVGDSLGPRVGDLLRSSGVGAYVYGTMARPITSLNIEQYARMVRRYHAGDVVVVIDATLGKSKDIGRIKLSEQGIKPGGAFHPERTRVGDIGLMAIVGEADSDRLLELRTRDERFVERMAQRTADIAMRAILA